jgi:hypothetical protein
VNGRSVISPTRRGYAANKTWSISRKGAKHVLSKVEGAAKVSFRPRGITTRRVRSFAICNVFHGGEMFLRSLAFARDDGPRPVTRFGANKPPFSEVIDRSDICRVRTARSVLTMRMTG